MFIIVCLHVISSLILVFIVGSILYSLGSFGLLTNFCSKGITFILLQIAESLAFTLGFSLQAKNNLHFNSNFSSSLYNCLPTIVSSPVNLFNKLALNLPLS